MKTLLKHLLFLAALLALSVSTAHATPPNSASVHKPKPIDVDDGASFDYFGFSASMSGDTAIIGAYGDDGQKGSAYIFIRKDGEWSQQAKLTAADGVAGDYFGSSVSVSGDTAVVGAWCTDLFKGAAYIFTRTDGVWSQQAKLTADDGVFFDYFGKSVSVSGDTVVVGAEQNDNEKGAVYVFTYQGGVWRQEDKLTAADANAGDRFGKSVSVSGKTVLVGAIFDDDKGYNSGSAYVFTHTGGLWSQEDKLTATDGAAGDNFGSSVSVSQNTAIIGALNGNGTIGSAYVFKRTGSEWTQQAKLAAPDGVIGDYFGRSVSVSGDTAIIGADAYDNNRTGSGSAYIFIHTGGTWIPKQKLLDDNGNPRDGFGFSVSISEGTAVIGSAYGDSKGSDSGSAYVFNSKPVFLPWLRLLLKR